MEHPLANVYFTERCNVCGKTYPVTLYEIFREQQLGEQWHSARSCDACDAYRQRLVAAVPARELAAAMEAWDRLAIALQACDLAFNVGVPADLGDAAPRRSVR